MPLKKGSSKKIISKNIKELMKTKPAQSRSKAIKTISIKKGIAPKKAKQLDQIMAYGRPTDYKPQYCDEIIKLRRKGFVIEEIAEAWNVHIDSIYEWRKVHPSFSEAFSRAKTAYAAYFARLLKENIKTDGKYDKVNDRLISLLGVWQMNLSNKLSENPKGAQFNDDIDSQRKSAKQMLRDRKITFKDYSDWMGAIAKESEIIERTETAKKVEVIEGKLNGNK